MLNKEMRFYLKEARMEKIKTTIRKVEHNEHQFYCDDCNRYLGSTEENCDGYYSKLGELELDFYLADGWYIAKRCFCEDCKEKYLSRLQIALNELGFEKKI